MQRHPIGTLALVCVTSILICVASVMVCNLYGNAVEVELAAERARLQDWEQRLDSLDESYIEMNAQLDKMLKELDAKITRAEAAAGIINE